MGKDLSALLALTLQVDLLQLPPEIPAPGASRIASSPTGSRSPTPSAAGSNEACRLRPIIGSLFAALHLLLFLRFAPLERISRIERRGGG
jgi:hypothetical protein